jgi:hypothetical protein
LELDAVALAIAFDDAERFPILQVVQELTTRDSYLAHEQGVDVVGGG